MHAHMETSVDPQLRGPDWMPITPTAGSLFHAETHSCLLRACNDEREGLREHRVGVLSPKAEQSLVRQMGEFVESCDLQPIFELISNIGLAHEVKTYSCA